MSLSEARQFLQATDAPDMFLDFFDWVGPKLEPIENPEAFYITYQLALADLAQGSLDSQAVPAGFRCRPLTFYRMLSLTVGYVAKAFRGPDFEVQVNQARVALDTQAVLTGQSLVQKA